MKIIFLNHESLISNDFLLLSLLQLTERQITEKCQHYQNDQRFIKCLENCKYIFCNIYFGNLVPYLRYQSQFLKWCNFLVIYHSESCKSLNNESWFKNDKIFYFYFIFIDVSHIVLIVHLKSEVSEKKRFSEIFQFL